jgi:hypothetical protein
MRKLLVGLLLATSFGGVQLCHAQEPVERGPNQVTIASSAALRDAPSASIAVGHESTASEAFTPVSPAGAMAVATTKPSERSVRWEKNKKVWFSLATLNHGAAAFDAWTTRSAVDRGARELNPLLRPFAGSGWIYPVAQVGPIGADFLAKRMMQSNNRFFRKIWWIPQSAYAVGSFVAGIHNMGVNPSR